MVAESLSTLLQRFILFLPSLLSAIVVFVASLLAAGAVATGIRKALATRAVRLEVTNLLARGARWTLIVLGTLVALEQVNFDVSAFLAGLGVAGLTIGFALQDIARNFVAGILLLIRQPFKVGDAIAVDGKSGKVLAMDVRDITIRTWDGEDVIVPNLKVYDQTIINYGTSSLRRRTIYLGLGYGQDLEAALAQLLAAAGAVDGVLGEPAPMIHAEGMGDYTVNVALRFWLDTSTHSLFDVHSNVILALDRVVQDAAIDMPYPMQTVQLSDR